MNDKPKMSKIIFHRQMLKGLCAYISQTYSVPLFVDMSGIIPIDEEEEQEVYDDIGSIEDETEAIDEDIYEELPGLTTLCLCHCDNMCDPQGSGSTEHGHTAFITFDYLFILYHCTFLIPLIRQRIITLNS